MLLTLRILYESSLAIIRLPLILWYVMVFGYGLGTHRIIDAYLEYRATFGDRPRENTKVKMLARLHRAALAHERQMESAKKTVANYEHWKRKGFIGYWWLGARVILFFVVISAFSTAAHEYVEPTLTRNFPVQVEWVDWTLDHPLHLVGRVLNGERYADRAFPLRDRPDKAIWDSENQRLISAYSRKVIPYRPGLHVYFSDEIGEMDPTQLPKELKR